MSSEGQGGRRRPPRAASPGAAPAPPLPLQMKKVEAEAAATKADLQGAASEIRSKGIMGFLASKPPEAPKKTCAAAEELGRRLCLPCPAQTVAAAQLRAMGGAGPPSC